MDTQKKIGRKVRREKIESLTLGASYQGLKETCFRVWAPQRNKVEVKIITSDGTRLLPMRKDEQGYFQLTVSNAGPGTNYFYVLDGKDSRPDPASRFQPHGVHGASEVIDPNAFRWHDMRWKGIALENAVIYEAHVGTFTKKGTFDALIERLPHLKNLGITCLEIMPIAQFPGQRNWGYDGVNLFAVQDSYGGPDGFKRLVDACHREKISVCLDVVYNHFGPEGNYLHDYGPYFTGKYTTPWGQALNYDDQYSGAVRDFIIQNALYWITEYHVDALRLDAVHSIYDHGPKHILAELKEAVDKRARQLKRKVHIFSESDMNDVKVLQPARQHGYGHDAQWSDDFHHAVHAYITGERKGYYGDYGSIECIATALKAGFIYTGQYSEFRKRCYGNSAAKFSGKHFIHCIQNHDQVGNRAWGERLSAQVSFEAQKIAAVLLCLGPALPLIWMGQEYGERAPFQYFIDHGDAHLIQAVRQGRKREFEAFGWENIPDPADAETFRNSKLNWTLVEEGRHAWLLKLYQQLLKMRKKNKILTHLDKRHLKVQYNEKDMWLAFEYNAERQNKLCALISFSEEERVIKFPFKHDMFEEILNTEDESFGGFLARSKDRQYSKSVLLNSICAIIGKVH